MIINMINTTTEPTEPASDGVKKSVYKPPIITKTIMRNPVSSLIDFNRSLSGGGATLGTSEGFLFTIR